MKMKIEAILSRLAKKIKTKKDGSTIVEVVVSFTVLLMCIAMVTSCVQLAIGMQENARERRKKIAEVQEKLYSGDVTTVDTQSGLTWHFHGTKLSFTTKVNTSNSVADGYYFSHVEKSDD